MENKKVAIIFYGLTRSLHKTHESIKKIYLLLWRKIQLIMIFIYILIKYMVHTIICGPVKIRITIIMKI